MRVDRAASEELAGNTRCGFFPRVSRSRARAAESVSLFGVRLRVGFSRGCFSDAARGRDALPRRLSAVSRRIQGISVINAPSTILFAILLIDLRYFFFTVER